MTFDTYEVEATYASPELGSFALRYSQGVCCSPKEAILKARAQGIGPPGPVTEPMRLMIGDESLILIGGITLVTVTAHLVPKPPPPRTWRNLWGATA